MRELDKHEGSRLRVKFSRFLPTLTMGIVRDVYLAKTPGNVRVKFIPTLACRLGGWWKSGSSQWLKPNIFVPMEFEREILGNTPKGTWIDDLRNWIVGLIA